MPLHWTVDSKEKLVIATAEGAVTRAEIEKYLTMMNGAGASSYRKLFDCSRGDTAMTAEDMLAIGVQIRARHANVGTLGPLAIVVPPAKSERVSRVLGILAAADRPMRIFSDAETARRWIGSLPK
ncbi:hypothetical protein [Reyranella sp.]|uniref:hypothetical protein n=1 Tax=Reyranella sp. TaxID=1929291 RepID=UPI0025F1244F|nr:hypothetical protein [Reyranella sp.]